MTSLLTSAGQPDEAAISREVERGLARDAHLPADYLARRREMETEIVRQMAREEAARFGKSPREVAYLDLGSKLTALDYARHLPADMVRRERAALHAERARIAAELGAAIAAALPAEFQREAA
ncbi:hypothetical protein [uncultured Enterovirga sp.]|uniref:hypothetical protein n=1 Tax=uncultured Enterovirga sp. TaxID=2026352 RepID=UPI0035CAF16F